MLTLEQWLQQFGVQALGGFAGAVLFAVAVSLVSARARDRFWRPIGRGLRWLTTVRLTTKGEVAAARRQADEAVREQKRQHAELRGQSERALETAQVRIASLTDQVEAEGARQAKLVSQLNLLHEGQAAEARAQGRSEGVVEAEREAAEAVERARAEGHAAGRATAASEMRQRLFEQYAKGRTEAQAEAETAIQDARAESWAAGRAKGYAAGLAEATSSPPAFARPDVVVEPVWRITRIDATNFWLQNVQEGVGQISDVRINTVIGEFSFTSGNQWPGAWGDGAAFSGELVSTGVKLGARMEISWTGPNGRQREADARIEPPPREPRRAVVL